MSFSSSLAYWNNTLSLRSCSSLAALFQALPIGNSLYSLRSNILFASLTKAARFARVARLRLPQGSPSCTSPLSGPRPFRLDSPACGCRAKLSPIGTSCFASQIIHPWLLRGLSCLLRNHLQFLHYSVVFLLGSLICSLRSHSLRSVSLALD